MTDKSNEDKSNDSFLASIATLGIIFLTSFYWGWVLMTLWGWFGVTFTGFAALPFAFWVGAAFIFGQFQTMAVSYDVMDGAQDRTIADLLRLTGLKVVASLISLGFAWLAFKILL